MFSLISCPVIACYEKRAKNMAISYLYVSKPNKLFQYVNMINIVFAREFFFRNGFQVQMFFNSKCWIASYRTFEIAWKMFLNAYLGDNACFL